MKGIKIVRRAGTLGVLMSLVWANTTVALGWVQTYNGGVDTGSLATQVLTPDGVDKYTVTKSSGRIDMAAPKKNRGSNLRELIWPANSPVVADSQSCATWVSESNAMVQEGLAVRIDQTNTRTRAITVTKNVIYDIHWVFNVHTWDTSNTAQPYTQIAQFDMVDVMTQNGVMKPLPWRTCTRIVGSTLEFKVWFPDTMSEPAWGDPVYSRSTTAIPADYINAGKTGWYVGHIPPAGTARYNNLDTWSYQ